MDSCLVFYKRLLFVQLYHDLIFHHSSGGACGLKPTVDSFFAVNICSMVAVGLWSSDLWTKNRHWTNLQDARICLHSALPHHVGSLLYSLDIVFRLERLCRFTVGRKPSITRWEVCCYKHFPITERWYPRKQSSLPDHQPLGLGWACLGKGVIVL